MRESTVTNRIGIREMAVIIMPILAMCLIFAQGISVKAANMKQISMNTNYIDSLSTDDEEKYYQFTMDKDGYFTITFSKADPTADVNRGWDVVLYNMSGEELVAEYGVETSYTSAKLDFAKGSQLYIKVNNRFHWGDPVDKKYNIEIKSVQDMLWEQEGNDSVNSATLLSNGVAKSGTIWKADEEDYYSYTIEKQGYFVIDLIREDTTLDINRGYDLTIYDKNGNSLDTYEGVATNLTSNKYNFMVGETIYIKINARFHWEDPVGKVYSIKVTNTENADWEKENRADDNSSWNDLISANNILSTKPITGHLWTSNDVDLYKYNIPKDGTVNLTFNVNNDSDKLNRGYDITFFDGTGKEINTFEGIVSNSTLQQDMPAGDVYIKVRSRFGWSDPVFNEYTISATHTEGLAFTRVKAAIKKPKTIKGYGKKRSVDVNWNKTEEASGYKIYRSTKKNGKYKCVGTVTSSYSTSWRDTKVKRKKTYYYKIRAYKDFYGKNIYSNYSSVKKIKVK